MKIKDGKVPSSSKGTSADFKDLEFNLLAVDPELKAELDRKGLAYRFINAKQYQQNYGFHRTGWRVYKREATASSGSMDFSMGTDPEGYVRRGDLILAVKPKEMQEAHKQKIRAKTERYNNATKRNRENADVLRAMAKTGGLDLTIEEGYGAEDSED